MAVGETFTIITKTTPNTLNSDPWRHEPGQAMDHDCKLRPFVDFEG